MSDVAESFYVIIDALIKQNQGKDGTSQDTLKDLKAKFEIADEEREAKSLSAKEMANWKKVAEALPEVASSLHSAIESFKKGDSLGGSAAIMDICSTAATVLGSLAGASAAGGPVGALVGSLFSVISMILRIFQPEQKSLSDVLEGKLRQISGEVAVIQLATAIDEFESLNEGYPVDKSTPVDSVILTSLAEGNAVNNVLIAVNWLLMENNIKDQGNNQIWLDVLEAYLQAQQLQVRNLTRLIGLFPPEKYPALSRTFKQIAKTHANKMRLLVEPVRAKGTLWHIGTLANSGMEGGNLYKRQGCEGTADWVQLGGEHKDFSVIKVPQGSGRHIMALKGDHKSSFLKSTGISSIVNTDWIPFSGQYRDVELVAGEKPNEFGLYAIEDNKAWYKKVTREGNTTTFTNMSDEIGFGAAPEGAVFERVRVSGGLPQESGTTGYALISKDGKNQIVFMSQPEIESFVITPCWDVIRGIGVDNSHLWIWIADHIACLSHSQIKQLGMDNAGPEQWKRSWAWHYIEKGTVLGKVNGAPGITYLSPSADGNLLITYNLRFYIGTPIISQQGGQFGIDWKRIIPGEGTRIFKEPVDCWPLFSKQLKCMELHAHA